MVKFCRNCGKELSSSSDRDCPHCGVNVVKASSYCRYCGHETAIEDTVCAYCGAAVRPIAGKSRLFTPEHLRLVKLGKTVNLTIVVLLISAYVIFSLPKSVTKPIKAATAEVVQASTGYTASPLQYISSTPAFIPSLGNFGEVNTPPNFTPNSTRQLAIYAIFKNSTSDNATKATRIELITENCTFTSSDDRVATVTDGGLVRAVDEGTAIITISYTAAPGSANFSAASLGKIPVTKTVTVPVSVGIRDMGLVEATYGGT